MKYLLFVLMLATGAILYGFTSTSIMDKPYYSGAELDRLTSNPKRIAVLETKQGTIKLQFFDKVAPKHVENFIKLAKSGFFDGTTFHRVIANFMIQGGDPNSKDDDLNNDGFGGSPDKVPAEFSKLHHARGILSAARSQDINSASSQFFICVADAGFLDGQYTVYGQVIEGMDVADKIVGLKKIQGDNPGKESQIIKVTIQE